MTPSGPLTRAIGIETEYGVATAHLDAVPDGTDPPMDVETAVKEIFRHTEQRHRSAHHFLSNGARLYVDIGCHPEYAGAECRYLSDILAQDRAGDTILADMVSVANIDLEKQGQRARIHLLKSNSDTYGNTFGCHENYQIRREPDLPFAGFVGFLAARQILTGAGLFPLGNSAMHIAAPAASSALAPMAYSARVPFLKASTSADPTHERAFINTRDEPHADKTKWRRLHVISGDSAMCEATTAVKVMLADGVLTLVESGAWDLAECELVNPVEAASRWNNDPHYLAERLGGLPPVSCVEMLTVVCDRIESWWQEKGVRPDELALRALSLARRGITALDTEDYSEVQTELDWAIKHRILSHIAERAPEGWSDPRVLRANLAFHDISLRTGLAEGLRTQGLMACWASSEDVERARSTPPEGTRAQIRGKFVAATHSTHRSASIGWAHVRLDRPARPQIDLPEPLIDTNAEVDALIGEIYELGTAPPEPEPPRPAPLDAVL